MTDLLFLVAMKICCSWAKETTFLRHMCEWCGQFWGLMDCGMCLELNEVSMSINELCLTTQVLLRLPGVLISTRNNVIVLMEKKFECCV